MPYYIYGALLFFQLSLLPTVLLLGLRLDNSDLMFTSVPFIKWFSNMVAISLVCYLVWTGFRLGKFFRGNIVICATTGLSFYLFSLLFYLVFVLLFPLYNGFLYLIILGSFYLEKSSFNFDMLSSLFTMSAIKQIALWTVLGTLGGILFNIMENRKACAKDKLDLPA